MKIIVWEVKKLINRKKIRNLILIFISLILFSFWITYLIPETLKEDIKAKEEKLKELYNQLEKTKDTTEILHLKSHIRETEKELHQLYEITGKTPKENWKEEIKEYLKNLEEEFNKLKKDYSYTLSREYYRVLIDTYKHYLENNIPPGERKNMPLIIVIGMLINNLGNIIFPILILYLISDSVSFEYENNGFIWILQTKKGKKANFIIFKFIAIALSGIVTILILEILSLLVLHLIYKPRWDIPLHMFTKFKLENGEVIPVYNSTLKVSIFKGLTYIFLYHSLYLFSLCSVFYFISILSKSTNKSYFLSILLTLGGIVIEVVDKTKKFSPWFPFSHYDVTFPFSLQNEIVLQSKNIIFQFPFPIYILILWSTLSLALTILIFLKTRNKNWKIRKE
ncbi:MAG: ABC transporter permease subunit [Candidatus Pacearchaeota archaeon]